MLQKGLTYLLLLFLFAACKQDFNPNGEYKQRDIIYGAISKDESVNKVQIFTSFPADQLNNDGTVENADAIYFQDSVLLEIIELDPDGSELQRAELTKTSDEELYSEDFKFNYNEYYTLDKSQMEITPGNQYILQLTNFKTNKVSKAQITCLNDFRFTYPEYKLQSYNFIRDGEFISPKVKIESRFEDQFMSNVTLSMIVKTFNTREAGGGLKATDTIHYDFVRQKSFYANRLPAVEIYKIEGSSFFAYLDRSLDPVEIFEYRQMEDAYLTATLFSRERQLYAEAEGQFNSLSQTKPAYTNIFDNNDEEQIGVFYSYASESFPILIGDSTMMYLDTARKYEHLGF